MRVEDFARRYFADALGVDLPEQRAEYQSFTEFKRMMYRGYINADHLQLLDEHLEQVTRYVETRGREGIGRLIIEMPPRHGKTVTTSQLFPIWHLGRNPSHRIMLVSYGQDLANKNSRIARNFIKQKPYFDLFGLELAQDSKSVREWNLEGREGGCDALGIGAGAAGKGAHVLVIDDPIKNRKEAESITYRDSVYDAYTNDLYTRLAPGGAVILMATRWHEDDLTGRVLKDDRERGEFVRLRLPALAEDDDALGRAVGEPLWAKQFPLEVLERTRENLGPYPWASLYQQRPQPASGGILKREWFDVVRGVPHCETIVRYWDLAMSSKTSADYTVGLKIGIAENGEYYILDVARARVELHDLHAYIKDVIISDGRDVRQGFEKAGYMTRAIKQLATDRQLSPYQMKSYGVDTDKLTRVLPAAARASLGLVHLVYGDWNRDFLQECVSFPNGEHDDQVDALSGAWSMLHEAERKPLTVETKRYA